LNRQQCSDLGYDKWLKGLAQGGRSYYNEESNHTNTRATARLLNNIGGELYMLYGLLDLSLGGTLVAILLLTQMTIAGVTLYLHRCQTHLAVELHPIVCHWFRFWLWLTTGMVTKEWVALHRKHHAYTEQAGDPHSPQIYGIKKVLFDGIELYREGCQDRAALEKYGVGTPNDWLERNLYAKWPLLGLIVMAVLDLILFGIPGITVWAIQMAWIPFFAAGVINGIGHYYGYRSYESADASRNIVPWGVWIGGEELHNNHHCCPSSAKMSVQWWEVDLGWGYIKLLSWLQLAKVKKLAPKMILNPLKTQIDLDTVKAITSARLQIFAAFTNEVIIPVFNQEKCATFSRKMLRQAKHLLRRNQGHLSQVSREYLAVVLRHHSALATAYDYRDQLQAWWSCRQHSPSEMLDSLHQWITAAEASNVESLQAFTQKLRCLIPAESVLAEPV
jgi:stearoyl-CoA desaturase (Delta-9 desaturase)